MKIKGFDKDLKCRGFQFEVGKVYDTGAEDGRLKLCTDTVFHYCDSLENVHVYYSADPRCEKRFCEIEVLGAEVTDGKKFGSNRIRIIREIVGDELNYMRGIKNGNTGLFNTGNCNTGNCNTGSFNTGDYNTGDYNTGYRNAGNYNTGDCNTGSFNTGDCNTGDCNTGSFNTGDYNTGDYNTGYRNAGNYNTGSFNTGDCNKGYYNTGNCNTGHRNTGSFNTGDCNKGYYNTGNCNTGHRNTGMFNICNYSAGFFCTEEPKARIFDIETDMTVSKFCDSEYYYMLTKHPFELTEWVLYTEEEKKQDKEKETTGGYLKKYTFHEACRNWWKQYSDDEKAVIMSIPNFDKDKFKKITGIEVLTGGEN